MPYNLTNVTNSLNIYDQMFHLNQSSNGLLGIAIMVSMFLILFIVFKQQEKDTREVLLFAFIITSILGLLLFYAGFIGFKILLLPMIGAIGILILAYLVGF